MTMTFSLPPTLARDVEGPISGLIRQSSPWATSASYSSLRNAVGFRSVIVDPPPFLPVQRDLPAVARLHRGHRLVELLEGEIVREHGVEVELGGEQQPLHPRPGIKHPAAVDSVYMHALEDNPVRDIDRDSIMI